MQLYLDGIPNSATDAELAKLFSATPSFQQVRVIRDIVSGKPRGFALATVKDEIEGQSAINRLNGSSFAGAKIKVFRIHDTIPGEMEFREWMRDHAGEILGKTVIRAGQTVVDYGCGPGVFSLASANIVGRQGKVYALDTRRTALVALEEVASAEGLSNLETILMERSKIQVPLSDGTADVVLLYDVLHEISDKTGLMTELSRLLRPKGILSVFPMHLGNVQLLSLVQEVGIFEVKDELDSPGFQSASHVINLAKRSGIEMSPFGRHSKG